VCLLPLGTGLFREKRWQEALDHYEEAAGMIDESTSDSNVAIWIACKLNAAQCHINMNDFPSAAGAAGGALSKDSNNVKALYRRGLSRVRMGLAEEALVDLNRALALDADNAPVKAEIAKAKKAIQDAKKKEKAVFGNMFSKINVYDDKAAASLPAHPLSGTNPKVCI
jgi:tetratricopeptide (TPR) repeat protein